MKNIDLNAVLRRIPPKWRLPVLTGVGILWLGLLGGLGWLFLGEREPELVIFDEAELEKAPYREYASLQLAFRAVSQGSPMQLVRRNGEKSPVRIMGPAEYLDILQTFKLVPPKLLKDIRKDAPDYLVSRDRYSPYAAYKAYAGNVQSMNADMLFEAGSLSGHIWLDKGFLEDAEPEANAEDGSLLICGDSRDGEVCLAFLDERHERRAAGESGISPDYRFIAATNSEQSARQEIALYRRLVAEEPKVLAALAREGLQAVKVEKVELRRNEKRGGTACFADVTVANTDPAQRDVEGVDLLCSILDAHGKPVERFYVQGNERQRISAGRRPRTYAIDLDTNGDARSMRQVKLLEGSYRLQVIPYACRLDGKQTRKLPNVGSELPEGVAFQNGVWMYDDAPLSLQDVPQFPSVDQNYADADAERLKAEMEARRPVVLRLATWLHNNTVRRLVQSASKTVFKNSDSARLNLTLTNTDAREIYMANLLLSFVNAEGYPCHLMAFRAVNGSLKPGAQQDLSMHFNGLPYFLLQEVQRGNLTLSMYSSSISFMHGSSTRSLLDYEGKTLQADVLAFYQRDGVWYHDGTALPAEAAGCTEKPLIEPNISPEDEEDIKARHARYQSWFQAQRDRLTPLVAARFVPQLSRNFRYRSGERVREALWIDASGGRDIWMLDDNRIPDDIVRDAGLEPWSRNEARKAAAETAGSPPAAAPAPSDGSGPATPAAADEDLTPDSAPAEGGGTPAAPAPEVAIAPSTPDGAPQAAASQPSREIITATAGLAESSAAHKTVFAIRFGNTAAAPARVSYRTFFLEGGKMFGRRESKLIITVPANGEQIVHLGSNKPELADIAARMRAGKVQMLVEIVDVEPAQ